MRVIALTLDDNINDIYNTGIIRKGENLATRLSITLPDDLIGFDYKLVFQLNSLTPIIVDDLIAIEKVVTFDIINSLTAYTGELKFEFHVYNIDETLFKSQTYVLKVRGTIDI